MRAVLGGGSKMNPNNPNSSLSRAVHGYFDVRRENYSDKESLSFMIHTLKSTLKEVRRAQAAGVRPLSPTLVPPHPSLLVHWEDPWSGPRSNK